jgi:hypothetical protein
MKTENAKLSPYSVFSLPRTFPENVVCPTLHPTHIINED